MAYGTRIAGRFLTALLAATALQGCGGMDSLNLLAAIDGPYVSPSEREEMARQQSAAAAPDEVVAVEEAAALSAASSSLEELPAPASPVEMPEPVEVEASLAASLPEPETAAEAAVIGADMPPIGDAELPLAATSYLVDLEEEPAAEAAALAIAPVPVPEPATAPVQPSMPADEAPALSSVGPDFLPPETPAPASPIPASVSTAFIGPVLGREERASVALETQLPSAYDYVAPTNEPELVRRPAPVPSAEVPEDQPPAIVTLPDTALASLPAPSSTPAAAAVEAETEQPATLANAADAAGYAVVSALPSPSAPVAGAQAPSTGGSAYLGFYEFALAGLQANPGSGARQSMLLLDPPSLDPELQPCGNQPPAVLIDLDPANGLLPLVSSDRASPELIGYLADLRQRGVTIFWISGHAPGAAARIRQRLTNSALDPDGIDQLIVTRFAGESKQARRYALGNSNCLLAILGDHRGDFDELYDFVLDPIMAGPLEVHIGDGWFIAPPPLD